MKHQLLKMSCLGVYRVIVETEAKYNPYRITYTVGSHLKTVARYGDFASCVYYLSQVALAKNSDMERILRDHKKAMAEIGS